MTEAVRRESWRGFLASTVLPSKLMAIAPGEEAE